MFGVWLGAYGMHYEPNYPALQLAGLFGTTLAPLPATSARYAAYWRGSSTRRWCCRPAARWQD